MQQGKTGGIGISGDVSINTVTDNVHGYIHDAGSIQAGKVDVLATNNTDLIVAAGAVSIVVPSGDGTSVGIAGSASPLVCGASVFVADPVLCSAGGDTARRYAPSAVPP